MDKINSGYAITTKKGVSKKTGNDYYQLNIEFSDYSCQLFLTSEQYYIINQKLEKLAIDDFTKDV